MFATLSCWWAKFVIVTKIDLVVYWQWIKIVFIVILGFYLHTLFFFFWVVFNPEPWFKDYTNTQWQCEKSWKHSTSLSSFEYNGRQRGGSRVSHVRIYIVSEKNLATVELRKITCSSNRRQSSSRKILQANKHYN